MFWDVCVTLRRVSFLFHSHLLAKMLFGESSLFFICGHCTSGCGHQAVDCGRAPWMYHMFIIFRMVLTCKMQPCSPLDISCVVLVTGGPKWSKCIRHMQLLGLCDFVAHMQDP